MSLILNSTVEYIPYHSVSAIDTMRSMPRFGHSSDFSQLFNSNSGEIKDYTLGLLFLGSFTLACFLVWFLLLAIFKCVFSKGVLGGHRSIDSNQARTLSIAFWIATGLSFIFTILLMTEGISDIQDTISTFDNSNQEISTIATEADRILISLQDVGESSSELRESLIQNLDNFCPANNDLQSLIGMDIESEAQTAIILLEKLSDFLQDDLQGVQKGISSASEVTKDIDSAITRIAVHDWQTLFILIPWILIPSAMSVGVLMAFCQVSSPLVENFMMWLFLPLLIILTIVSVALAALISLYSVGNADFCYGGSQDTPNESVFKIVNSQGYADNQIMYQALNFYINQCQIPSDNPFSFLEIYQAEIQNADSQLNSLSSSLDSVGLDQLTVICGRDFQEIAGLADQMTINLSTLKQNALDTLELLRCDHIVPIYTSTFFDATCTSSIQGATWAYSALVVMSLMGMVMIMCRSAYLTIEEYDDKNEEKEDDDDENDDEDDESEYADEGEERVYSASKNHRTTDPDSDSGDNSYQQGSYVSDDYEDVFSSVGNSEEDKHVQYTTYPNERIHKSSYVSSTSVGNSEEEDEEEHVQYTTYPRERIHKSSYVSSNRHY